MFFDLKRKENKSFEFGPAFMRRSAEFGGDIVRLCKVVQLSGF